YGGLTRAAKGSVTAAIRMKNIAAPATIPMAFAGVDGNGRQWTQQISVPFNAPLPPANAPVIQDPGGVVNGASFASGLASGAWMTIRGTKLSATTRIWQSADFQGAQMPTSLDGVSVSINGRAAYVYYVSPTQLNVLAPGDDFLGAASIQVKNANGASNTVIV